ncbi:MAG TPA: alpha/beta fold hydrolase [Streptosporangiaceae bacterium]|nr:alpha/beta fold hydrolase [Streptosporangiaceae bacterium]
MTTTTEPEILAVTVAGRTLKVAVRRGKPGRRRDRVPLLLFNGIGASLELLRPFVDELDPALDVIRFDPPGVGGSAPSGPYRFGGLCKVVAGLLSELGYGAVDVLGISWSEPPASEPREPAGTPLRYFPVRTP